MRKSTNKILLIHATEANFTKIDHSHRLLQYLKPGDQLIEIEGGDIDYQNLEFQKNMEKLGFSSQKF